MRRLVRAVAQAAVHRLLSVLEAVVPGPGDDLLDVAEASTTTGVVRSPKQREQRERHLAASSVTESFADARARALGSSGPDFLIWEYEIAGLMICADCSQNFHPGDEGCTHHFPPLCGECARPCFDCTDEDAARRDEGRD